METCLKIPIGVNVLGALQFPMNFARLNLCMNNCINPEYYNTACETIAKRFDSCSKFYSPSTTSPSAQPSQPTPPSASTFCSTFEVTFAKMDYVSIPDIEFAILVI